MFSHTQTLLGIVLFALLSFTTIEVKGQESDSTALAQLTFSREHGFYDEPFSLGMSCDSIIDADIYYTTDGSIPSSSNGTKYNDSLKITGTVVLRAVAFKDGACVSDIATASYFFLDDIIHQSNTPEGYPSTWGSYTQISGTAIADYEMDPDLMEDEHFAEKVKEALRSLPVVSLATDKDNFFSKEEDEETGGIYIFTGTPVGNTTTGRGWKRPVSFEYFDAAGKESYQIDCSVRLHGGHSRLAEKSPKHSMRLTFSSEYGPKKMKYPIFGENEEKKLNCLILRAGFGSTWHHWKDYERAIAIYTRDSWAKQTLKDMGHLSSNFTYAHLFINGLYWGMYVPNERIDDEFCELHMGGAKEDYDVIKADESASYALEAGAGTLDKWEELWQCALDAPKDNDSYLRIQGLNSDGTPNNDALLDIEEFIDYMLINQYGSNTDWDHQNWTSARSRVSPGKGFHIFCWDSEQVLKTVDGNVLTEYNEKCPSGIFTNLMKNIFFKRAYINQVHKQCFNGGALTPDSAQARWERLNDVVEPALYAESARWGDYRRDVHRYSNKGELFLVDDQFQENKEFMIETYFPERTAAFIKQLRNVDWFPDWDAPDFYVNGVIATGVDTLEYGDTITIAGKGHQVYYTTNGDDPVTWTFGSDAGKRRSDAIKYSDCIIATDSCFTLKAQSYVSSNWSALSQQTFYVKQPANIIDYIDAQKENLQFRFTASNGSLTLSYYLLRGAHVTVELFDMWGRKLELLQSSYAFKGDNSLTIPITYPSGVYLCRFTIGEIQKTVKISL